MVDTLVGNVVLTGILALALILFVVSASGLAQIYSFRLDQSLLLRESLYVSQSVQQLYTAVNSTQTVFPQSVTLRLNMPVSINGNAYNVLITSSPDGKSETNLTVTLSLQGTRLSAGSSVVLGQCTVGESSPLIYYPTLNVNLTLSLKSGSETCTIYFY
jgi:hypothetical protein